MTEHQLHAHRYANSHHAHDEDAARDLKIRARHETTSCQHQFVHMGASHGELKQQTSSDKTAALIEHLEQHSLTWVARFAAKVNGGDGGLTQKFLFNQTQACAANDARSEPTTALAILEAYGQ